MSGDAGLHLDPITGQGTSDAFRDAEPAAGGEPLQDHLAPGNLVR